MDNRVIKVNKIKSIFFAIISLGFIIFSIAIIIASVQGGDGFLSF